MIMDSIEEFNRHIKFLMRIYVSKENNSSGSLRMSKRLNMLVSTDPVFLLEKTGPVFLKYRDYITST